jgi:hypothetical protein
LRSLRPPKLAVLLMRVIESMAESIWSWLASRSAVELAPVLADSTSSDLIELRRSLTSLSEDSVVARTELARSPFLIPWSTPWMSLLMRSEEIRPAGSSAPRLMRRPVESRSSLSESSAWFLERFAWAMTLAMLVLMRAMTILRD